MVASPAITPIPTMVRSSKYSTNTLPSQSRLKFRTFVISHFIALPPLPGGSRSAYVQVELKELLS